MLNRRSFSFAGRSDASVSYKAGRVRAVCLKGDLGVLVALNNAITFQLCSFTLDSCLSMFVF
jgi:hypothetical protein